MGEGAPGLEHGSEEGSLQGPPWQEGVHQEAVLALGAEAQEGNQAGVGQASQEGDLCEPLLVALDSDTHSDTHSDTLTQ